MKLGANNNVTPESWVDYAAIAAGLIGIIIFSVWTAGSYLIAVCTGRGEAWR
jgi:hypothetical protein